MYILRTLMITLMMIMLTSPLFAKDPYKAPNNSWISLSGTVAMANPSSFELDYGTGLVTVEMDGWNWYSAARSIIPGDEVIVYGYVDDDLYEVASIEAGSVYVKDLNTFFYANDADEEDVIFYAATVYPDTALQVQGTITEITGREFTLNTGTREVRVDTIGMRYNPLDNKGYQKLKKGDLVHVSGKLDIDFFEKTEIMAENVTTLLRDISKRRNS